VDLSERPDAGSLREPWETARFHHFQRVLARAGLLGRPLRVLDIGSGDGWFAGQLLAKLPAGSTVTAWDHAYDPASLAALPEGVHGVRQAPAGERFDLVMLLDVLEHVDDDEQMLGEAVAGQLAEGGHVLVSVPAWPALFGRHDEALGHFRRYRPAEARRLVDTAGLDRVLEGGLFGSLLAPRALQVALERRQPAPAGPPRPLAWSHGAVAAAVVDGCLRADAAAGRVAARAGAFVPGLSWWALCRRAHG